MRNRKFSEETKVEISKGMIGNKMEQMVKVVKEQMELEVLMYQFQF